MLRNQLKLSHVFRYDPKLNTWEYISSLPSPRCFNTAGVLGDEIVIIGGRASDQRYSKDTFVYDTRKETWFQVRNFPRTFVVVSVTLHRKIGAGIFTWRSRQTYLWAACILEPHVVFLRCLRLQVILTANTGIFTCGFACRTSGGLHAFCMRVKWGLPEVQIILSESRRKFFLTVAGKIIRETGKTAGNFFKNRSFQFFKTWF